MTVSELIEKLSTIDGDAVVLASDNDGTEYHIAEDVCVELPEPREKLLIGNEWCSEITTIYLK